MNKSVVFKFLSLKIPQETDVNLQTVKVHSWLALFHLKLISSLKAHFEPSE